MRTKLGSALLVLLAAGVSSAWAMSSEPSPTSRRTTVNVRIHHSRFALDSLEVDAGTTVRFVLVNVDPIDHEFIVGNEDVQAVHERGTEAHHPPRPAEVSVPAGSTRSTTYTFDEAGTLLFGCHIPGHYAYGMRGEIIVD